MNKGTKLRTVLRVVFSIYTTFCMWETTIAKLSEQLQVPGLVVLCAVIIVLSGLLTDFLTTYFNNDFTTEACIGTGITRQLKAQKGKDYIGEIFFEDVDEGVEDDDE